LKNFASNFGAYILKLKSNQAENIEIFFEELNSISHEIFVKICSLEIYKEKKISLN
jgi:hypothetical protein